MSSVYDLLGVPISSLRGRTASQTQEVLANTSLQTGYNDNTRTLMSQRQTASSNTASNALSSSVDKKEDKAEDSDESTDEPAQSYFIAERLEDSEWKREVGDEGVWTLSSAKPGYGVEQLRDGNAETYWQSDGNHPHLINIHFHKKMRLQEVALYLDYALDESYTPNRISIRVGTDLHDVHEVQSVELESPQGWLVIPIGVGVSHDSKRSELGICRAHILQIAILSSHQNGRDTHIRQVRVFAPRESGLRNYSLDLPGFTSLECQVYSTIR